MRRSSRWRSRSGSRPCWSSGTTRCRGAPMSTARSRPISWRGGVLGPVPRGGRADLAAGPGLSARRGGGLCDRRRGDAPGLAASGARTVCPGRSPRLGRHAAGAGSCRDVPVMPWTAGLIAALHPTLVYAATHVQVAGLGATLLVWTLAWAYRTGRAGRRRDAIITGVLLAVLALTDPILSLAMHRDRAGPSGWPGRRRGPFAVASLIVVDPRRPGRASRPGWCATALVHGEFVAIKSTFGYAFWQGNCRLSEGTDKVRRESVERVLERGPEASSLSELEPVLWEARHEAGYLDDIALTRADYRCSARSRSRSGRGSSSVGPGRPRGRSMAIPAALPASAPLLHPLRRDEPQDAGAGLSAGRTSG